MKIQNYNQQIRLNNQQKNEFQKKDGDSELSNIKMNEFI